MATESPITFLDLPNELIIEIANHVESQTDASRLSRTNRRLHELLTGELLRRNVRDNGSSAALWAFRNNHIEMLSRLHGYGANLNDPKGMPPRWGNLLGEAAGSGNIVMVEILIQLGVDPMQDCWDNHKPLVSALQGEQDEVAKMLVAFLPSLEYPLYDNGRTVLHVAAACHRGEVVRHLLDLGADSNLKASNTKDSTFDEMLDEEEVICGWYCDEELEEERRDGNFNMLIVLLENGAEPDDEAYAKGTTSSIARVRHLFCDREVSVNKSRLVKARPKIAHRAKDSSIEVDQDGQRHDLNRNPARTGTSTYCDAFPQLSDLSNRSAIMPKQSWNPLKEPMEKRFPLLGGQAPQTKNAGDALRNNSPGTATNGSSQSDSSSSKSKKSKASNRKWQKLQF